MNEEAVIREWLTREHQSGSVLEDRGDGLHWLRCVDCGDEWAEDDDGACRQGSVACNNDALAALDVLVAERDRLREALETIVELPRGSFAVQGRKTYADATMQRIARAALSATGPTGGET